MRVRPLPAVAFLMRWQPTIFPPQPVRTSVIRRAAITNRRNLRKIERRRIQSETLKFNETAKFSIWKTTKKRANLQVSYISTVRKLYLNASILLGFLRFLMAARRIMDVLSGKIVDPKSAAQPSCFREGRADLRFFGCRSRFCSSATN